MMKEKGSLAVSLGLLGVLVLLLIAMFTPQKHYNESFAELDQPPSREIAELIVTVDQGFRSAEEFLCKEDPDSRDFCIGENCSRVKSFFGSLFPDEMGRTALRGLKSAFILVLARIDHGWEMLLAAIFMMLAGACDGFVMRKVANEDLKSPRPDQVGHWLHVAKLTPVAILVVMVLTIPWFDWVAGGLLATGAMALARGIALRERHS